MNERTRTNTGTEEAISFIKFVLVATGSSPPTEIDAFFKDPPNEARASIPSTWSNTIAYV